MGVFNLGDQSACGRLVAVLDNPAGSGRRIALPDPLADGRYSLRLVSASRVLSAPVVVQVRPPGAAVATFAG